MKLEDGQFKLTLKQAALHNDIILNDKQLEKFLLYKNKLIEYNEKINLTAITGDEEIIYKHFVDCLEIVKYISIGDTIIDVGSGAGFPGIVISIYFENKVNITLLDSLNKRVIILNELIKILELKGITTIHGRAEEIAHLDEYRENFDIVTARAVAKLKILLEYTSPFIKINGKCLLLKGNNLDEELKELNNIEKKLNLNNKKIYKYSYIISKQRVSRNIITFKKSKELNRKYPRSSGKIKKER